MTTKLEQAARQALEALENAPIEYDFHGNPMDVEFGQQLYKAITALREALDHSGEADEMVVGWDRVKPEAIASDPLYQQGFVDGVEEGRNQVAEQSEQKPVAWVDEDGFPWKYNLDGKDWVPLYAAPVRTKDLTDIEYLQDAVTKALKKAFHLGQTYWQQADSESYAANKKADVTQELFFKLKDDTRAVIAADRSKNGIV